MRFLLAVCTLALVCVAWAKDEKTWTRTIPADQLRDFPGLCFASTQCTTIEPGKSWDLKPFCGKATCKKDKDGALLEVVDECKVPKENPKCKLNEAKTKKDAAFPECCPVIECEKGVKLEYPDAPPAAAPAPAKSG